MGRTLPSATQVFEGEAARWARFRRALRAEDQALLDELFVAARRHIVALGNASSPAPMEGVLLAMLIETKHEIRRLSLKLQRLDTDQSKAADALIA